MKTKIFSIMASVAMVAAGFASCSDNWEPDVETSGTNAGEVGRLRTGSLGVEVTNGESLINDGAAPQKAKSREAIDLSNYIVTVTDKQNGEVKETWKYSEMPELPIFAAGDYTVKVASSEAPEQAGWNCPYFVGQQDFTIEANKITDVEKVICTLENIRVTVVFKETLLSKAADDVTVVVTSEAGHSLTFTPGTPTTDAGYFASTGDANQTLRVAFTGTVNGAREEFVNAIVDVKKGQHRKIIFGLTINDALSPEEQGVITIEGSPISVNTDVIEEDLTVLDNNVEEDNLDSSDRPGHEVLPEEPDPGTDTPPSTGDDTITFFSETLKLDGVVNNISDFTDLNDPDLKPTQEAKVIISSTAGIANLWVTINANAGLAPMLPGMGLDKPFDLAHPVAGTQQDNLTALGFPLGDQVIGNKEVTFNITDFVPLLGAFIDSGSNNFVIRVVDQKGNEETLTLYFE